MAALAHPIRRGIVERLTTGPATVGAATRDFAACLDNLEGRVLAD